MARIEAFRSIRRRWPPIAAVSCKVRKAVTMIIDEPTGKMLHMKQPCIMLEGVVCKAEYASCRLNCPRAIPSYWREIWLERVEDDQRSNGGPNTLQGAAVHVGGAE